MKIMKKYMTLFVMSIIGISMLLTDTEIIHARTESIGLYDKKQDQQIRVEGVLNEYQKGSLNMEVSIDELGIANKVAQMIQNAIPSNFSRSIADEVFRVANNQYNVIVFTSNSAYKYNFNGIKFSCATIYNGNPYYIWVFEYGRFEKNMNKGNYAYRGWFRENERYVAFYRE